MSEEPRFPAPQGWRFARRSVRHVQIPGYATQSPEMDEYEGPRGLFVLMTWPTSENPTLHISVSRYRRSPGKSEAEAAFILFAPPGAEPIGQMVSTPSAEHRLFRLPASGVECSPEQMDGIRSALAEVAPEPTPSSTGPFRKPFFDPFRKR